MHEGQYWLGHAKEIAEKRAALLFETAAESAHLTSEKSKKISEKCFVAAEEAKNISGMISIEIEKQKKNIENIVRPPLIANMQLTRPRAVASDHTYYECTRKKPKTSRIGLWINKWKGKSK